MKTPIITEVVEELYAFDDKKSLGGRPISVPNGYVKERKNFYGGIYYIVRQYGCKRLLEAWKTPIEFISGNEAYLVTKYQDLESYSEEHPSFKLSIPDIWGDVTRVPLERTLQIPLGSKVLPIILPPKKFED